MAKKRGGGTDFPIEDEDFMGRVSNVVAAYLSANPLAPERVPAFIDQVAQALARSQQYAPKQSSWTAPRPEQEATEPPAVGLRHPWDPAVPIEHSVQPDFIICLEDGQRLKLLKRHLRAHCKGMTLEQYREKWGLPDDYPVVAPNYARRRSELARENLDRSPVIGKPGPKKPRRAKAIKD